METLFILGALLAGALLVVQAGANTQLSRAVGSPFGATTIQLGVGTAALVLVAIVTGSAASLGALSGVPWWHAVGGSAGAFYVVSAVLLFPRLGAVVSVGLFIAGQMTASLGLDVFGLLGVTAKPLTASVAAGTVAVLAGAVAIVFGQERGTPTASVAKISWIFLALLAGAALPVQGAVNGLLRHDLGAPFAVGVVSFIVATLSMLVALLLATSLLQAPRPRVSGVSAMPWWGWLGGLAGASYVITIFTAIPVIGVATAVGLTIAGQQIASALVDHYGWFRLPARPISTLRLAGVGLLLAGVALIKLV